MTTHPPLAGAMRLAALPLTAGATAALRLEPERRDDGFEDEVRRIRDGMRWMREEKERARAAAFAALDRAETQLLSTRQEQQEQQEQQTAPRFDACELADQLFAIRCGFDGAFIEDGRVVIPKRGWTGRITVGA